MKNYKSKTSPWDFINYSQKKNIKLNNNPKKTYYKCYKCGKTIPLNEKKDHLLSLELEQEGKKDYKHKYCKYEDLFNNLSPEEIEEQRKIENKIKREQRYNHNFRNNDYININFFTNNDFNIDNDFEDMDVDIDDGFDEMNMNVFPNMIMSIANSNNNRTNIVILQIILYM